MKFIKVLILAFLCLNLSAQEGGLLIRKKLVDDLSKTPIYPRLVTEENGKKVWKEQFKYLDNIEIYVITYLSDGLKVNGLMVKPKAEGNHPCIIFNRGGNRDFGQLILAHGITTLGQLANEGYVVIASQYRGNGGSEGQEEFGGADVHDVTILTQVLEEIEGTDTDKIGMYGWSRGGMMTYRALTETDKIKAAVVGGALTDAHQAVNDRPEMEAGVYGELIPNFRANREQELDKRSAVKWVDQLPKDVPILMLHGNADWRVKPEQSLQMALEFQKYKIPYRLIMFEGSDHGISEHKTDVNQQVIDWFDRYLKNSEALPNMEFHGK